MDRILLKQKYQALEQATAGRLETFNGIIREERRNRNASKEKIDYFNEKRKIIMRELNLIREAIKRNNFIQQGK